MAQNFDHKQANISTHQYLLTIAWGPLINIGIILIKYKHYQYLSICHLLIGLLVILQTILGPVSIIIERGFQLYNPLWHQMAHNILGFIMLCVIGFQGIFGLLSRIYQIKNVKSLKFFQFTKQTHKYLGYTLIIMSKFVYLQSYLSYSFLQHLLLLQIVTFTVFFYLKFKSNNLNPQNLSIQNNQSLKIIKNIQQIGPIQNFFIFQNLIFSISQIQKYHPGGVQLIKSVAGKQVDRFIFGCQGIQNNNKSKHQHSKHILKILQFPIGKFLTTSPFDHLNQYNECFIKQSIGLKNQKTYLIKLFINSDSPIYRGYQQFQQFGYYYSLSLDKKVTRLYSAVNCLRDQNIKLILAITNSSFLKKQIELLYQTVQTLFCNVNVQDSLNIKPEISQNWSICSKSATQTSQKYKEKSLIPLLIKKYDNGKLTSLLFKNKSIKHSLQISCPRGQGIKLNNQIKGKIIILCGGTGLFPFIDFIDILYKKILVTKQDFYSNQLLCKDPILKHSTSLNNIQIILFLSINCLADIHPLILFQINQLCHSSYQEKFVCKLKCLKDKQKLIKHYKAILNCENLLQQTIKECEKQQFSRLYICGPAKMQKQFILMLQNHNILKQKCFIV